MARPRKALAEQRTRRVAVYFTDDEFRVIYREARRRGMPPALFVYTVATGRSSAPAVDSAAA